MSTTPTERKRKRDTVEEENRMDTAQFPQINPAQLEVTNK